MVTDINSLDVNKTYSYAEYLTWRFSERVEIIKGRLFKMTPAPARKHQKVSGALFREISSFLKKKSCDVYSAPFDVRLPQKGTDSDNETYTVVQPDICIVCDQDKLDDKGCVGAPDLVVEILSPASSKKDLTDKFNLYEESRVKEYWVVFPDVHVIEVFAFDENGRYYLKDKFVKTDRATSDLLPGLEIDLTEVFED
jgi:Uma2 family endonuclease